MLPPGIAWLSSSSAEIARARDVLKALTPGGVIDELGYLVLQGAFADHFYPAVTTPMTRARYLVFVPAIYQYLEQSGKAVGKDANRISRDLQFELLKSLLKNESTAIGKESGRNIVRTPSEIYWNALAVLGIATQRLSESGYQNRLSAGHYGRKALRDDDDAAHPDDMDSLWNQVLRLSHVMSANGFPESTDFRLRRAEALVLQSRYGSVRPGGQDNLITQQLLLTALGKVGGIAEIDHLWNIPGLQGETAKSAHHARMLSLFARGTTLQYYRMVIERKKVDDTGAAEAFAAWWERASGELANWNIDGFFSLLHSWSAATRPRDRGFLTDWIARCVSASTGKGALNDVAARTIIAERERYVRPGKERLRVKYQLDAWKPFAAYPTDVYFQLEYRHRVGRVFAQDIADGLDRGTS